MRQVGRPADRRALHSLDRHSQDASASTNSAWHLPTACCHRPPTIARNFDVFDERPRRTICVPISTSGGRGKQRACRMLPRPTNGARIRQSGRAWWLWRKCAWMGNLLDYIGDLMTTDLYSILALCTSVTPANKRRFFYKYIYKNMNTSTMSPFIWLASF